MNTYRDDSKEIPSFDFALPRYASFDFGLKRPTLRTNGKKTVGSERSEVVAAASHAFLFAGLTSLGTIYAVYYSWPITELNLILENLTFVLALSAGWAAIIGETIMFVEKYFEIKEENLRQEGLRLIDETVDKK